MSKLAIIGVGAVLLVGGGVWIGRTTQTTTATAEPTTTLAPPRSAVVAVAPRSQSARPVAPALPARTTTIPGLAADLIDADPRVRRAAVREAARGDDADPAIFLAAARDRDLEVGVAATEALSRLHARGQVSVEDMIARATDRSVDDRVRMTALNGLGLVASPEAARTLGELAGRGDLLERRSAAILLAHQDPELAIPALIAALGDADEVVRGNALEALRSRARGRDFGSDAGAWRAWWQARSR